MKSSFPFSIVALISLWLAFAPASVFAQAVAGDNEIEVAGGFSHTQGSDIGNLNAQLHYGYYLTQGWELGLRQALNYEFIEHERDFWTATTAPFLRYNFQFGKFVPYLGGQMGVVWNDRRATGTVGPDVGLKIFLSDQTYFGAGYRYEWFFKNLRTIGDDRTHGTHVVSIGLGYVWGGAGRGSKP